jgi:hypothetical protein
MSKYKIVPNSFKFKTAEELDSFINIDLSTDRKELIEFDKNTNLFVKKREETLA